MKLITQSRNGGIITLLLATGRRRDMRAWHQLADILERPSVERRQPPGFEPHILAGKAILDEEQTPSFRLTILISRLGTLLEGDQAYVINRIGLLGDLKQVYLQ